MKAQSKRFVNHKGNAYDVNMKMERNKDVGFLDLWRYATLSEKLLTCVGVLLSWCCSAGLVCAVVIYGEVTSLFVMRHKAEKTSNHAVILELFGGGRLLSEGNRSLHMDALVDDAAAFAWASVTIMVVQFTAAAVAVAITSSAATNMVTRLRWRLLRSLISQEVAFFETNSSVNFASSLTEDVEKLRAGVGEHVVMTSYLCGTVVFCLATSLLYGWQLTLVAFAIVPLAVLVAATVAKYQTRCSEQEVSAYSAAGGGVQEALAAVRTVRAYGGEEEEVRRYISALKPAASHALRRGAIASAGQGAAWLLTYSLNATVFAYGAALCVRDMDAEIKQYHPGVMLTILFCTFMAAQNIAMCHPHLEIFSAARGAAKSLFKLVERKSKIDALEDEGVIPEAYKGDIKLENVYFNYPSRPDAKVLRGLTLSIKAGQTVALVGGSGCGKSTVLQLLQRLYEPDSGVISIDGHRLKTLHLHEHRKRVGVVGQEPVLFTGTIRENIMLGLEGVSEKDMIAAAKTAHAHQFIMKLDKGYDSRLGSGGASLSGGQKQRVAIARALLRKPSVMLLDEPTSALDPASERQVQAALDAASEGRTTIVVSHRLSTIVNASLIVYMEQGAVLEQGTHQELMDKKGMYWKLVNDDMTSKSIAQAAPQDDDDDVIEPNHVHFARDATTPIQESMSRMAIRRSLRVGSMSAAHVPASVAPQTLTIPEEIKDDSEESEPVASTWELLKLNRPEWPLLLGGGIAAFLLGAAMPAFALLFSKLYGMFAWSDQSAILHYSSIYAGIFGLVAAGCGVVMTLQGWLFSRAGQALTDRLRVDTFRAYLRQEQAWFDDPSNSVGALCARLSTDCANVQGATGSRLGTVLLGISTMSLGVTLAMLYSWKMTLVSLLSVPCVIGGIYLEGYMTKRSETEERRGVERASRVATEAVLNLSTVQSLGVEWSMLEQYRAALPEPRPVRALIRGAVYGLCLCSPTLGYAISLAYGGYLIARDSLNYEYAILVSEALIYGAWMLAEALSFAPNFAAARRSGARVLQILNKKSAIVTEEGVVDDDWQATGAITFTNVHFTYPRRDTPALRGVSVGVPAGSTLALVGPSGCGKSTLTSLLGRVYDPSEGTIELDGRDIRRSLSLQRLRSQLGLVQQEPVLFSRSIMENIAYGDLNRQVTMEEIIEAAKKANVHGFVSALPLGYATPLGAGGGASLSGGQKQRVAIARALLRNPKVLILDEATSALDANSEKLVQEALEQASQGRTTIIIAHRLATVAHANIICVLQSGKVAEAGTHEELVKKHGLYWDLLQQQGPHGTTET